MIYSSGGERSGRVLPLWAIRVFVLFPQRAVKLSRPALAASMLTPAAHAKTSSRLSIKFFYMCTQTQNKQTPSLFFSSDQCFPAQLSVQMLLKAVAAQ